MKVVLASIVVCGCLAVGVSAHAAEPLTLDQLVQRARQGDLRVKEADAELMRLRALYREASWAWFPKLESTAAFAGPTPEAKNDGLGGPPLTDATLMYDLDFGRPGVMMRADINAFVPIFTFGKLDALEAAAEKGVEVGEGLKLRAEDQAAFDAAQAFYGFQLARQARTTIEDTLHRLESAEKVIKDLIDKESPQVSQVDIYKVQYFRQQLQARLGQADAGKALALTAARLLIGAGPEESVEIAEQDISAPEIQLEPIEHYYLTAFEHRPELKSVKAGLAAREKEVFIKEKLFLPDFGLVGFFRWMYTTSATRQLSPFAYDPYNDLSGGVAVVARATFDFPIKSAQLEQSRAELLKLEVQRGQLEAGIRLEVRKAYGDLQDALIRAQALEEAERNAKRWATAAFASFEIGTADTRELTEAFTALASASAEKFRAWHDAALGIEALSRAVGMDLRRDPKALSSPHP